MDEPNPYDPPKGTDAQIKIDLLKSKSIQINKIRMAAMLLFGAFFISLPSIVPPGDMIRDITALGMTGVGLIYLISAIFN